MADTKQKTKTKAKEAEVEEPTAAPEFGVKDIIGLIKAHPDYKPGKREILPKDLRNLIRKMAREGRVSREVIPGNKTPYSWPKGAKDPEVKAIVEAWVEGEYEQVKKQKLDELKAAGAKKRAEKQAKKEAAAPVEDDEEEELEEVEDDEE